MSQSPIKIICPACNKTLRIDPQTVLGELCCSECDVDLPLDDFPPIAAIRTEHRQAVKRAEQERSDAARIDREERRLQKVMASAAAAARREQEQNRRLTEKRLADEQWRIHKQNHAKRQRAALKVPLFGALIVSCCCIGFAGLLVAAGLYIFGNSQSAIHEIEALFCWAIAAILFATGCVIYFDRVSARTLGLKLDSVRDAIELMQASTPNGPALGFPVIVEPSVDDDSVEKDILDTPKAAS